MKGERSQHLGRRQKVTIKVEATVVRNDNVGTEARNNKSSKTTTAISKWRRQFDLDAKLNESTFVGVVESIENNNNGKHNLSIVTTPTGMIQKGTLVTSIRKCATRARIVTLPAEDIISLSTFQDLDSGEVAALVSTYLPAFGALHHGIDLQSRNKRFTTGSLSNCEIMVSGGSAIESEAVIKLAFMGGAARIFVFPSSSSIGEYLKRLNSHKVVVLDGEPKTYLSRLHQKIDVIIDLGYLKDIEFLNRTLSPKGRLVCVAPRNKSKNNIVDNIQELFGQAALIKHPGTSVYDFDEMSKSNYGEVVRDLQYLLDLTQKRKLRPKVDRYVKARDVEIMLEDMAVRPPRGAVICEPWREFVHEPETVPTLQERLHEFCSQTLLLET
jgi:NADPH:quinone reductase-like Zn-dependent oxidoreductase